MRARPLRESFTQRVVTNAGRPGDKLVLTKPLGTGIIATAAKKEQCPAGVVERSLYEHDRFECGRERRHAGGRAHAATDITGFGWRGRAREMADGSSVSLRIETSGRLPVLPASKTFVAPQFLPSASKSNREYVAETLEVRVNHPAARPGTIFRHPDVGRLGILASRPIVPMS